MGDEESPPPAPPSKADGETSTAADESPSNIGDVKVGSSPVVESNVTFCTTDTIRTGRSREHRGGWVGHAAELPKDESGRTRVTPDDVAQIFRASVGVHQVSAEQIERVKRMHDRINQNARIDFDYCCLLLIAGIIAGLGLVSNSSAVVISSMLISPLMGPVVGMAYGTVIWDRKLVIKSFRTECLSLLFCVILGLIIGCTTFWTKLADDWATSEMTSRGTMQTFLTGIPTAFFSGLAVGSAVLDDQSASLVGVAISASLLPPAVNCGILWLYEILIRTNSLRHNKVVSQENFFSMGLMSLALTLVNIVTIWVSSMLMFRIKEVLPIKKKPFWDDLKTARRIYQKRALAVPSDLQSLANEQESSALPPGHTRSQSF